ncbi:Phox-associated domain [Dillenia turbinata]|uniref:Phox-associated domain n=1 Tax=Dillenia turbinata TaxID=194707 RepID=A0AAN8ULT4_9MAGN
METLQDLIDEAMLRTVWWGLCIFVISYFLSHTSKSMWMNVPVSILLASGLHILLKKVEFRWKSPPVRRQSYLSHLEKKQLSPNDPRLSTAPPPQKWKRKIDSPLVEAAADEFIKKILQEFVIDLWYSDITPDKEAPELIHSIVMDVLGEISRRVKEINLVDLLTRDIVDLIGDHIDLFRRNQAAIGVDVIGTLSSEERDDRLKHHLMTSRELHPALISPECEYKVLQQLIGGVLAIVLRPREAQCPLVWCFAREFLTCLVLQPVMSFASPEYINEVIEYLFLNVNDERTGNVGHTDSARTAGNLHDHSASTGKYMSSGTQKNDLSSTKIVHHEEKASNGSLNPISMPYVEEPGQPRPADWARKLDAVTQRRTEVLMPENLENMWARGRNYQKKAQKYTKEGIREPLGQGFGNSSAFLAKELYRDTSALQPGRSRAVEKLLVQQTLMPIPNTQLSDERIPQYLVDGENSTTVTGNNNRLKRSNSTSALTFKADAKGAVINECGGPIISEHCGPNFGRPSEVQNPESASNMLLHAEGQYAPKLRCRVLGAYFEKLGSKSFAVYSIAVTDAENHTWFVKRRYRNFEHLHRHLKEIPNYTLHLPPKRIFSSSTEDAFVHQRCIQLDKYLQDLLSIANVAEQHEVWDFLINVDDAVDDIVRQFKGVSDGLMRKVVGPTSSTHEVCPIPSRNTSWSEHDISSRLSKHRTAEVANCFSDNEKGDKDETHDHEIGESNAQASGWHSDNELNSKSYPPRVVKRDDKFRTAGSENDLGAILRAKRIGPDRFPAVDFLATFGPLEDPEGMPPEWTPSNVSVPLLNLVDKIFQLKRRGWIRRQVFWISKQILQLIMEDAIDDWLLRQIQLLRRDDIIALGIRWVQDILWPDGTFLLSSSKTSDETDDDAQSSQKPAQMTRRARNSASKAGSFEMQLEASRRASDVKKIIFDGAPSTLVSLIGHKQYRRCAKDIYYFLQSNICIKQLAYGVLELLIISVFPELRDLIIDIHKKMRISPNNLLASLYQPGTGPDSQHLFRPL